MNKRGFTAETMRNLILGLLVLALILFIYGVLGGKFGDLYKL
ncbi:MAG: hypothetical protein ACE5FT_02350 [Candidatus Nanoarchaeia archaeon]